jgi:hypothetical protein
MPPLILHNVPDEELYVGEDGVQRPYAMLFPGYTHAPLTMTSTSSDISSSTESNPGTSRSRRAIPETGSFGKSTRRSRSRTGTPATKREDPTIAAADKIFSEFLVKQASAPSSESQRISSLTPSAAQPNHLAAQPTSTGDGNSGSSQQRYVHKEPTEVILRGYKSTQQYAAIREYERIAGQICEDYPRDPPQSELKYKSPLGRDPTSLRPRPLTPEERAKALRFAGGEHWIKITFQSAEAAELAVDSSPQIVMGHLVYAELYRGVPPTNDEAMSATGNGTGEPRTPGRKQSSTIPRSFTPSMTQIGRGEHSFSPEGSNISSQTLDTGTLSTTTATTGTITGHPSSSFSGGQSTEPESTFCQRIPTAKRIQLLPAEQALLPQQSYSQRILSKIPLLSWFSSDIIGSQVPKTENGEFDWAKASLYWRIVWWLDGVTGWFDVVGGEKEE